MANGSSDRRRTEVCLTARGRRLISSLFLRHAWAIEDAFSTLDEAEQRELPRLCRRLGLAAAASATPGFRVTMAQ